MRTALFFPIKASACPFSSLRVTGRTFEYSPSVATNSFETVSSNAVSTSYHDTNPLTGFFLYLDPSYWTQGHRLINFPTLCNSCYHDASTPIFRRSCFPAK